MATYLLKLSAAEVVRLLREETTASSGEPELNTSGWKDYIIEEEFNRAAYGIEDGQEFDLVTSVATLNIEPRVEDGYWILQAIVERELGPVRTSEEGAMGPDELTLDEFEAELQPAGRQRTVMRLTAQTPDVRKDFDRWLDDMRAKHPPGTAIEAEAFSAADSQDELTSEGSADGNLVREAVGVFRNPDDLEAAVDALETAGFDRAQISVLGTSVQSGERGEQFYRSIKDIEDDPNAPLGAFVSSDSRTEAEAAAIGIPFYIGGIAGAWGVVAAEGALAAALAGVIAGGVVGAGLGTILAAAIESTYRARIQEQVEQGGLGIWVQVTDARSATKARSILERAGAKDVHIHEMRRTARVGNLVTPQADLFLLEADPVPQLKG